ncbi:uncharacterized protein UTRI_10156 [Ustilago trichophora]|uniref:Uncharacterized protein n=1 Tax=Ustilago trichophora TaxID=86804 RepID=A0A5C3EB19_9BASI|nr:uncharacterized protein UTRI_10156 [Ustilago trichophora]
MAALAHLQGQARRQAELEQRLALLERLLQQQVQQVWSRHEGEESLVLPTAQALQAEPDISTAREPQDCHEDAPELFGEQIHQVQYEDPEDMKSPLLRTPTPSPDMAPVTAEFATEHGIMIRQEEDDHDIDLSPENADSVAYQEVTPENLAALSQVISTSSANFTPRSSAASGHAGSNTFIPNGMVVVGQVTCRRFLVPEGVNRRKTSDFPELSDSADVRICEITPGCLECTARNLRCQFGCGYRLDGRLRHLETSKCDFCKQSGDQCLGKRDSHWVSHAPNTQQEQMAEVATPRGPSHGHNNQQLDPGNINNLVIQLCEQARNFVQSGGSPNAAGNEYAELLNNFKDMTEPLLAAIDLARRALATTPSCDDQSITSSTIADSALLSGRAPAHVEASASPSSPARAARQANLEALDDGEPLTDITDDDEETLTSPERIFRASCSRTAT